MDDLTILYYTANRLPIRLATNVKKELEYVASVLNIEVISISQRPINLGRNICIGDVGQSIWNLYTQVLLGAKAAKTPYVAMWEDDCLYNKEHFKEFRPVEFAYNHNKWNVCVWHKEKDLVFSSKDGRSVFSQLIAKRESLIDSLEQRLKLREKENYQLLQILGEPGRYNDRLKIKERKIEIFKGSVPNVVFDHLSGMQSLNYLARRKRLGPFRETHLEPWGSVVELVVNYMGKKEWKRQQSLFL